ncbi:homocysteine S-methyltransferase family protein [Rhizobium sp. CSW-27]|uniref:homocysteine S-methyltransferase family protein n=1 Tax=Rhizobium sp. CSW-27 TaxID=2839985 RepID=UPI001C0125E0|nr:homocysteine S-methyltransferase family protein [Rhizobium sp. CSW-27]MBT9368834.1 homocysteine S-methyltransferase family protein [Rhizobium sp. CSW-27]
MGDLVILDGGMSRELVRLGAELKQPEWSALALIDSPAIVRQVHADFIAAGADVVTTNSYALVPFHIGEERFATQGASLIALSGRLAREAADAAGRPVKVAGGLPPIFGSYEPENFDASRVQDYLSVLVENLDPFVDVWLGETLSLIAEGEAVRVAVAGTGKPFWISFTLADDAAQVAGAKPKLRSGEAVADAAAWAAGSGAAALLFNCARPEVMEAAVRVASDVFRDKGVSLAIGVYANAFESDTDESAANEGLHDTRKDLTSDVYSRFACNWAEAGASMIGGCCGIGAEHIHQLAGALKAR